MSFDNYLEKGRKAYRDSRRFDRTCRNHGSCEWCENRRRFFDRKQREDARMKVEEWLRDTYSTY